MTEKDLERLLAEKETSAPRENISLVLSPSITRNAMRLKKLRHDRIQAAICCAAAIVFLIAAAGAAFYLKNAENPEAALRPLMMIAAGGMGMTLLLAPALAWFADEERKNEA